MFVVKDLAKFVENVRNSASDTYGSDTVINHRLENFTESGRKWINFINDAADEEKRLREG